MIIKSKAQRVLELSLCAIVMFAFLKRKGNFALSSTLLRCLRFAYLASTAHTMVRILFSSSFPQTKRLEGEREKKN